jgi:hypothetical protein
MTSKPASRARWQPDRRLTEPDFGQGRAIRTYIAGATGNHHRMSASVVREHSSELPRIPASAGALIFDAEGRLLILKPSYKKGWTIPGGQIEADGESPWAACQREPVRSADSR